MGHSEGRGGHWEFLEISEQAIHSRPQLGGIRVSLIPRREPIPGDCDGLNVFKRAVKHPFGLSEDELCWYLTPILIVFKQL